MTLLSPRSERKYLSVVDFVPVLVVRSVKYLRSPAQLGVPSTLKSFLGSFSVLIGRWRYLA